MLVEVRTAGGSPEWLMLEFQGTVEAADGIPLANIPFGALSYDGKVRP